jgi:hypothetical protein
MSRLSSLSYSAAANAFVLVPYKILIHEHADEDEKNQIRSHAHALCPFFTQSHLPLCFALCLEPCASSYFPHSAFRIPTSEFLTPET